MNAQDAISAEQGSKPSKQVALGADKIFRITTTIEVLHERYSYVAARSVAEARGKHEHGLSVQDPNEGDLERELLFADGDGTDDEPVEITDRQDLEYARELIAEQR